MALGLRTMSSAPQVIFVGDGVNDAVALTSAEVGVAIGAGARLTVDAADVVLVRSDLQAPGPDGARALRGVGSWLFAGIGMECEQWGAPSNLKVGGVTSSQYGKKEIGSMSE